MSLKPAAHLCVQYKCSRTYATMAHAVNWDRPLCVSLSSVMHSWAFPSADLLHALPQLRSPPPCLLFLSLRSMLCRPLATIGATGNCNAAPLIQPQFPSKASARAVHPCSCRRRHVRAEVQPPAALSTRQPALAGKPALPACAAPHPVKQRGGGWASCCGCCCCRYCHIDYSSPTWHPGGCCLCRCSSPWKVRMSLWEPRCIWVRVLAPAPAREGSCCAFLKRHAPY